MSSRKTAGTGVVIMLTLAACSASRPQSDLAFTPAGLAGCYEIELFPDDTGSDVQARRARWGTPPVVRLDTARLTTWPSLLQRYDSVFVAYSVSDGRETDIPFTYWRFAEGDSVFIGHPGALAGVSMTLSLDGDDLVGRMTSFTDVRREDRPSTEHAPVRASRATCPE